MITAWIIFSIILGIAWLIAFGMGVYFIALDGDDQYGREKDKQKEHWRVFSAIMTLAMVLVLFHWVVLVLAIPVFLCYGVWQAMRLAWTRPWSKTKE